MVEAMASEAEVMGQAVVEMVLHLMALVMVAVAIAADG